MAIQKGRARVEGKVVGDQEVGRGQGSEKLLELATKPLESLVKKLNACNTPEQRQPLYARVLSILLNHKSKVACDNNIIIPFSKLEYSKKVEFFDVMHKYAVSLIIPLGFLHPEVVFPDHQGVLLQSTRIRESHELVHSQDLLEEDARYLRVLFTQTFYTLLPKMKEIEAQLLAAPGGQQKVAKAREAFGLIA